MLFNSIDFAIFLPIVFILYWFVFNKKLKAQNALVFIVSYIFYGWWDWRFLSLILFSTVIDYSVGIALARSELPKKRKWLLWISIFFNLGFLGVFKYYNFFLDNFKTAFSFFGSEIQGYTLEIILPVGISFYTFQTLSYTIDVYKKKLVPTKDFIAFGAFVSFFPQLVAGPIERATHLLPQFYKKRIFDYALAVSGLRQIIWGLFKKIVIADNAAQVVTHIFSSSDVYNGSSLLLGALFFAFQIYGDFSGYSDIAIGTSRLFGFDLMKNFAFPYFSRDIAEFWRRWHISLSTWFRDYLYIPLGGSRGGLSMKIKNTFIIFIVSGFWHGANWTFIVWGALNALYFLPVMLLKKNRINTNVIAEGKVVPTVKEGINMGITFGLTLIAWVFFRADNIGHAWAYLTKMLSPSLFEIPNYPEVKHVVMTLAMIVLFVIVEWFGRADEFALEKFGLKWHKTIRLSMYYSIVAAILLFMGEEQAFIYFQF